MTIALRKEDSILSFKQIFILEIISKHMTRHECYMISLRRSNTKISTHKITLKTPNGYGLNFQALDWLTVARLIEDVVVVGVRGVAVLGVVTTAGVSATVVKTVDIVDV